MALRGLGGIDPIFFGTGFDGDLDFTTDDSIGVDKSYRILNIAKASGGDPNFLVDAPGIKLFATRKITIGAGATLSANGRPGTANSGGGTGGVGGIAGTYAAGKTGGAGATGATPAAGVAGFNSTTSIGGSGGDGGSHPSGAGGAGGSASPDDLVGLHSDWISLIQGGGFINGVFTKFEGGGGGGGGGVGNGGGFVGGGGGGGGGGGIILLAAPEIEIAGTLTARGGKGGAGAGNAGGVTGGGGGGGGGAIILICGKLTVTGTLIVDGGDGGDGGGAGGAGHGGIGGAGGHIYLFGGTDSQIYVQAGDFGNTGT